MKTKLTIIGMLAFVATLLIFSSCYNNMSEKQPKIDLPEEFPEISQNINKPDTLTACYTGDKLFFRFIPH